MNKGKLEYLRQYPAAARCQACNSSVYSHPETCPKIQFPDSDLGDTYWFWCYGCDCYHRYMTKLPVGESGPVWAFNNDLEKPTFTPSLLCRSRIICHLYVTDGMIQYLGDCGHALAGKTVALGAAP